MSFQIEPRTRRCRTMGHRWVSMDGVWTCVRKGCEACYDPHAPRPMLLDDYTDEALGQWLPIGPPAPPWGG